MKIKYFITLLMLAVSVNSKSYCQIQKVVTYYDMFHRQPKEVYYINTKTGQNQGKYIAYFENGAINRQCEYVNGELNGKDTWYYEVMGTRGLASVGNYKMGQMDGPQSDYSDPISYGYLKYPSVVSVYKNGDLVSKKIYGKDVKVYLAREEFYDRNEKLIMEKKYDENGKQWYQMATNGKNFSLDDYEFYCKNGLREGLFKGWSNGKVTIQTLYRNGIRYWSKASYDDGKPYSEIDSTTSTFTHWYENGNVRFSTIIVNGEFDGEVKTYYDTGELQQILNFKQGKLDGSGKEFFKDGKIRRDHQYKDGYRVKATDYKEDGTTTQQYEVETINLKLFL